MEKQLHVADILNIIEKRGAKLVSGKSGLKRVVKHLDVLEQPQIEDWVREGTIFITTGYVVRDDKDALLNLIQVLFDRQAAALAIKTRFFRNFPKEALELSDRLDFPLMLLEDSVSFVDIIYPIMEALVSLKKAPQYAYWNLRNEKDFHMLNTHLFLDIAFLQYDNWNEMKYRINALHWPETPVRLASIRIIPRVGLKFVANDTMDLVFNKICGVMGKKLNSAIVILKNDECLCIFPEYYERVNWMPVFYELRKHLLNVFDNDVYIGISGRINDYQDVHYAYEDTQDAIKIGRAPRISKDVVEIESVQFEQALLRTSKDPYFQQQAYDIFSIIKQYDAKHDCNMMETLEVFISNSGIRKAAAEQLHLHRNTMAYRIKKIEELINADLSDNQDLMRITLLLNIRNYL
ncbi:MAG: PucR family transcriptional regulator [Lachnospiraceae bacterium]